ncbi:hypothetical protein FBEOM_4411 [Fusarium beomiforme]|uniref:Uncharacterized protein n=1 Tax=Fusarium beomiforme TaxID=44412 RepID=A0A9P5AMY8_9HYPO|nr:hypothetical protein FBEOM_4411 [Fusarium beomiforme]
MRHRYNTILKLKAAAYHTTSRVAEYASQCGFCYSDMLLEDQMYKLSMNMSDEFYYPDSKNIFSSSFFCWMIYRGANVASTNPTGQRPSHETKLTAAYYFMAALGAATGEQQCVLDSILSSIAFEIIFSGAISDTCWCLCSPAGCTPLVKLLEGIYSFYTEEETQAGHDFDRLIQETEDMLTDLCDGHTDRIGEYQWIYGAIVRYYTFAKSDLRHVCCPVICGSSGPAPVEEHTEIQEEDSILLGLLESLVKEFEHSLERDMGLEDFFEYMRMAWAPGMRKAREYLASQRLTDQELRNAKLISVVWETYGPQPVVERLLECKEPGGLWDAMSELDKIATDLERPMTE